MKLSIGIGTAATALGLPARDAAKVIKSIGFTGVDFDFCNYNLKNFCTDEVTNSVRNAMKEIVEEGLQISQSHLHYLPGNFYGDDRYGQFEEEYLQAYIRSIELCGEFGCKIAVIHLYFEDSREKTFNGNITMIKKLLPHLEKHGVTLAIENIFKGGEEYLDCFVSSAKDILEYVNYFNSPYVGACLDTGHANCRKLQAIEMAKEFGEHLVALHMNSNSCRDLHLIPGTCATWVDPTDYGKFAKVLKDIDYKGPYNLEIGCGQWPHNPKTGLPYLQLTYAVSEEYLTAAGIEID